jgi:nucleoside-diphosphate-sugar epimerase
MLNLATKNSVKKFVFASSTAIYGDAKKLPISEETSIKPISPYAASKVVGEAYCSAFVHCYGIETVVLRFFNIYGLRSQNSYTAVLSQNSLARPVKTSSWLLTVMAIRPATLYM